MNFFDRQAVARRQSALLLLCFVAALMGMALIVHVLVTAFSLALGEPGSMLRPSTPALSLIGLVWLTVLFGAYFRYLDVKAGGAVLARRFGAVHASDRSRFDQEQQLLNIVAEISIASSTPQPDVFVLRNETSINAFVLGSGTSRHVVVLTQGALDAFDRDQLQAVVAHEFGHIKNGDLPMNMRLLVALGGLMAIDEVGRMLVGKDPYENSHPGIIVGYILRALGSVGVLAGKLIRAAFSRQREYLADASAAQFTRNPFALASALDVIQERAEEPALHSVHAEELAHMCFQSGRIEQWYRKLLATHPAIQLRIDAIEPRFAIKQRKARRKEAGDTDVSSRNSVDSPNAMGSNVMGMGSSMALSSDAYQGSVSGSDVQPVIHEVNSAGLSDRILLLLPDESSCLAILFALFASKELISRRNYFSAIGFSFNQEFADEVKHVLKMIPDELQKDQLSLIDHATAVLCKTIKIENRQRILIKLERLLNVDGDCSLMNYAKLQLIRRRLDLEFPIIEAISNERTPLAKARRAKAFDAMGAEFALLLSLIVETSGAPAAELDDEFNRVLKCYTQTRFPRRTGSETGIVTELEAAFQTLYVQPKSIREAFVQHCIEIIQKDGYIAQSERALLDLFAASLGCEELAIAA